MCRYCFRIPRPFDAISGRHVPKFSSQSNKVYTVLPFFAIRHVHAYFVTLLFCTPCKIILSLQQIKVAKNTFMYVSTDCKLHILRIKHFFLYKDCSFHILITVITILNSYLQNFLREKKTTKTLIILRGREKKKKTKKGTYL